MPAGAFQARVGVIACLLVKPKQCAEIVLITWLGLGPSKFLAGMGIRLFEVDWAILRRMDGFQPLAAIVERSCQPNRLEDADGCCGQAALDAGNPHAGHIGFAARVRQQEEELGGLQADRFVGVVQHFSQKTKQAFLFRARFVGLPKFCHGEIAETAMLAEIRHAIREFNQIGLRRTA